ncbi:MAG: hypothetical protein WC516_09655 [Patescibacteria group bacterium]|jgi:hypothetical protein
MNYNNLILRKSKIKRDLILSRNIEGVYRIFLFGQEIFNDLNYNNTSNKFNELENNK